MSDNRPRCPVCNFRLHATQVIATPTLAPTDEYRDGMLFCPNDGDELHETYYRSVLSERKTQP